MIPIFLALFVPLLLTAAAMFSVVFPLALFPLLTARSRLFPTLLVMGVICQVALVLTGWIAADAFARLATQALAAMAASGDAEVLRVGGELDWATGILTRTALALVAPTLGLLAWSVFLRPSGAAAAYFAADTNLRADQARCRECIIGATTVGAAPRPLPNGARSPLARWQTHVRWAPSSLESHKSGSSRWARRRSSFGAAAGLRPQLSYVGSQPAPGATLARGPATVRVTLAARLDPGSSVSLIRLAGNSSTDDAPRDVEIASRLATRRSRTANDRRRARPAVVDRPVSRGLVGAARWRRQRPLRLVLFRRGCAGAGRHDRRHPFD